MRFGYGVGQKGENIYILHQKREKSMVIKEINENKNKMRIVIGEKQVSNCGHDVKFHDFSMTFLCTTVPLYHGTFIYSLLVFC